MTPELRTVEEAIAWLGTERANLHACAGYAAAHGCLVHAVRIPAAMSGFLHTQGHWNEAVILGQAWTLNQLGVVQMLTGDYPAAASLTRALELSRDTWATGTARLGPSTSWAWCSSGPGTTRLPPPA